MGATSTFSVDGTRDAVSWVRLTAVWILLTVVYFGGGKLGLELAIVHRQISAVWPATGISLAAFLVFGYRVFPAIFLGAFLVNITTKNADGNVPGDLACLGIAAGNMLEGLVGAFLVNRFAHGAHVFERPRDVFRFTLFAALTATMVSATCGVLCLGATKDQFLLNWGTWWLGDAIGALVIAPPLILWSMHPRLNWDRRKFAQAAAVLLGLLLIGQFVFGDLLVPQERGYPLAFACLPLIIWVAFVFGQREMATVTLLLAALAIWGTQQGAGPFASSASDESIRLGVQVLLQAFLGITSVTGLTLASVIAERNRVEAALREAHAQLEDRVKQRTRDLASVNDALNRENEERHQVEQALRSSQESLSLVIETAYDAYVAMDPAGLITDWNAQAEKTFGWLRRQVLGRSLTDLIIPLRHRADRQGLQKYLESGENSSLNQRIEFTALHRDGHEFPVELTFWMTPTPESVRFNAFIHDITERKDSAEKLRQAERLAAIGEMITGLAHESRNALQQSQACLELLALKSRNLPDLSGLVEDIQKSQDHLHHLFEEVRGYAAPIKLRRETIDLGRLLDDTWNQLALVRQGRQAQLIQRINALTLGCSVDRQALQQVFRNILENALQACADPVEIHASWTEVPLKGQSGLCVSLSDNGPGLTAEARKKIFQPFFTTKIQGTGLGLAISRRIVEAHQGTIAIGTKTGGGTEILICLPKLPR